MPALYKEVKANGNGRCGIEDGTGSLLKSWVNVVFGNHHLEISTGLDLGAIW
jgi:hypothetical protein